MTRDDALCAALLHIATALESGELYSVNEDTFLHGEAMHRQLAKFARSMFEDDILSNWGNFCEKRLSSWKKLGWDTSAIDPR